MFAHLQAYLIDAVEFMLTLNPNINWVEVLNDILTFDTEKQLSKIKTLLWTDKDIESVDTSIEDDYVRYMELIFNELLKDKLTVEKIYVLSPPDSDNELNISDFARDIVLRRFDIIKNLCSLYGIKYVETNKVESIPNGSFVFPTCSIMYRNNFDLLNVNVICDGYYNLYSYDVDKELCLFKLSALELANNPEADVKTTMTKQWNIVKIPKTN